MKLFPVLPAIACIALLAPAAAASDRYFLDSYGVSSNGRFRIDAKSPDNAGGHPRPFASNFTYTLTDTTTKTVVWERKQPMIREKGDSYAHSTESSPVHVFVNDDGLVAAHLSRDSLLFLDAADGHKRGEAAVLDAFPKAQREAFVRGGTGGPRWTQDSDWFFLSLPAGDQHPAATYFVVRPFWDHRLIVDIATYKHVDLGGHDAASSATEVASAEASVKRILVAALAEESRHALATLVTGPECLGNDKDYRAYWDLRAAIHTVGFLKLGEAEPRLRLLNECPDDAGEVLRKVCAKAREALRSIGKIPDPGFGFRLYPTKKNDSIITRDESKPPFVAVVPSEQRVHNASKVTVGMSARELTDLIGCPDAWLYDGDHCYDYDIDAPTPYTLRVFLDAFPGNVRRLKIIKPFAFLHDNPRKIGD